MVRYGGVCCLLDNGDENMQTQREAKIIEIERVSCMGLVTRVGDRMITRHRIAHR